MLATALPDAVGAEKSQDYLVHVWQTDDGLPQNWVSSIAQTRDGYLWIGTRFGGLARFDGIRFACFTPQNTPAFQDVQVERLSVDAEGTLWIPTTNQSVTILQNGQFRLLRARRQQPQLRLVDTLFTSEGRMLFNEETGMIAVLDRSDGKQDWSAIAPASTPQASSYHIYPAETFHRDHGDNLWYVDQQQRLARVTLKGAAALPALLAQLEGKVNALSIDRAGALWIVTDRRILSWDGSALADHTPADARNLVDTRQIAFSGDGGLWVFGQRDLRKLVDNHWTVVADSPGLEGLLPNRNYKLYGDSRGGAWIARYGFGLLHVRADGRVRYLTEKQGLPNDLVTCWFEDREGNIWIGTTGGGIARISERVFRAIGPQHGLPERVVRSVGVDQEDTIWIGTMSGKLARWRDETCTVLDLPRAETTPIGGITVWPSRSGPVWIGSLYHGLMRYEQGEITHPIPTGGPGFILTFFESSKGDLWIGEQGRLGRYRDNSMQFYGAPDGFETGVTIGAIAEDESGAIWIGTDTGKLWRFADGAFTRYNLPEEWPSSRIVSLLADTDGVIWIGTLGNGLLRFQHGTFTRYRTSEGLPDDNVTQLLDDNAGQLWAGTYRGIFRARKDNLHTLAHGGNRNLVLSTYGRSDGLPALECTAGFNPSCWKSAVGTLWFSTTNGLVSVIPAEAALNQRPPDVIIEELQVDGEPRPLPTSRGRPLEIEPGRHFLQFRYTGLSFSAPEKVRFRWRLGGVESEWQNSGLQRVVGVGPLAPGNYELQVRACNADGVWNGAGASLAFAVLPDFWETWWFKVAAAFAALAGLSTVVLLTLRRRYQQSMERLRRQHEVERERSRIARDLHDDLGTSLTQISMLSALADREQTPTHESKNLVRQVHGRAREMVTALDEIVWAVNPKNDSWGELANYLGNFAEEFLRPTDIRCRLDIPDQMPVRSLSADGRHHIFLAFKEALNNAARHSGATQVLVRIEPRATEVVIAIEDDGHGVATPPAPPRRQGSGLGNMQRRMEQIGGSAEVRDRVERGTTVEFRVPLG